MQKIEIISLVLILFSVLLITLGIIKLHTYPGKVAEERNHPQKDAIEVTSLLGLIIFPFWMFALVWAYSGAIFGALYDSPEKSDANEDDPGPDSVTTPEKSDANEVEPGPDTITTPEKSNANEGKVELGSDSVTTPREN